MTTVGTYLTARDLGALVCELADEARAQVELSGDPKARDAVGHLDAAAKGIAHAVVALGYSGTISGALERFREQAPGARRRLAIHELNGLELNSETEVYGHPAGEAATIRAHGSIFGATARLLEALEVGKRVRA